MQIWIYSFISITLASDLLPPRCFHAVPSIPSTPDPYLLVFIPFTERLIWWPQTENSMTKIMFITGVPYHTKINWCQRRLASNPSGSRARPEETFSNKWWQLLLHVAPLTTQGIREKTRSKNKQPGESKILSKTPSCDPNNIGRPRGCLPVIPHGSGTCILNEFRKVILPHNFPNKNVPIVKDGNYQ